MTDSCSDVTKVEIHKSLLEGCLAAKPLLLTRKCQVRKRAVQAFPSSPSHIQSHRNSSKSRRKPNCSPSQCTTWAARHSYCVHVWWWMKQLSQLLRSQ